GCSAPLPTCAHGASRRSIVMSKNKSVLSRRASGLLALGGILLAVPVLFAVGCAPDSGLENGGTSERTAGPDPEAPDGTPREPHKALACGEFSAPGFARCHARVRTEDDGQTIKSFASPSGLGPSDLKAAYNITGSSTGTVAIVDAQDDPN